MVNQAAEGRIMTGHQNFVTDLDVASLMVSAERCVLLVPLTDVVRSPNGHPSIGVLASLADIGTSGPALARSRPDWTATQDIELHLAAPLQDGPILVDNTLLRVGKKVVVVQADLYDGAGLQDVEQAAAVIDDAAGPTSKIVAVGTALVSFARLPGHAAPGMDDYHPGNWIGEVKRTGTFGPVTQSMYDRMGLIAADESAGAFTLDQTSYVVNSIGTIFGGAQAVLVQAAAEAVAPGLIATDLQIHYLSQLKVGPAGTSCTVIRASADRAVISVALLDRGNSDALLAVATVTVERPAP